MSFRTLPVSVPSAFTALALCLFAAASPVWAQDQEALASYYRAVGSHFGVPPTEVMILSEWRLPTDEIPVVLYVAGQAGISAEAVVALRRGGQSWAALSDRYGLGAGDFYVALSGDAGPLARAYEAYASRPRPQWSAIALRDEEVVGLVNLQVLSGVLGASPAAVLAAYARSRSWVAAYRTLARP